MESKKFLNAEEVAAEFGVDAESLKQFVEAGDVRALADRGTWKYRRDELQALVDAGRIPSPSGSMTSLSDSDQVLAFQDPDDVSYIELDEDALSEQATQITRSTPSALESEPIEEKWFTTSDEAEVTRGAAEPVLAADSDSDVQFAPDVQAPKEADSGPLLNFNLDVGDAHALGGDSAIVGEAPGSGLALPPDESGISLDESGISLDESAGGFPADSGITLQPDSGLSIEAGNAAVANEDSGLTLAGDSGLALSSLDSGLGLEGESGLSLGSAGDSGLAVDINARTQPDRQAYDAGDQTVELSTDDDSSFEINLDDSDATAELLLGDEEADDSSATVVRKGRPAQGSLSAAFELDDGAEVEDLEISEDLDAGVEEEVDLGEEEEVFDSSDDMFGEVAEAEEEEEDYLEPAAKSKKAAVPREPSWGAGMAVGLVAGALFLTANTMILWAGVSTMWTGAEVEGPAATLIQSLGDLIQ